MSNHIQFEGPWTQEEKRLVRSAVREAEPIEARSDQTSFRPLWVATCTRVDGWGVFGASRYLLPQVFAAKSAAGLAEQIQDAGSGRSG